MSRFIEWVDARVSQMRYFDVAATKLAVMLFTLFLVKIWPPITCLDWRWYLGLSFVVAAPIIYRIFERGMVVLYLATYAAIYLAVEFLTTL